MAGVGVNCFVCQRTSDETQHPNRYEIAVQSACRILGLDVDIWNANAPHNSICTSCVGEFVAHEEFVLKTRLSIIDQYKAPTTYERVFSDPTLDLKRITFPGLLSQEASTREKLRIITKSARRNETNVAPQPESAVGPLRRSKRQTLPKVKDLSKNSLVEEILAGDESGLQVQQFEGKGRGVVAVKKFRRWDFVVEYAGELLETEEAFRRESRYDQDPNVGSFMYYFQHNSKKYCVDATEETGKLGRLINHKRKGNLVTKVIEVEGIPRIIFMAKKRIEIGEEIRYDYGDRDRKALAQHPWLAD